MASSKPIFKMLYLSMDQNFGEQQAFLIRNVVLYDKEKCRSEFNYIEKNCNNKIQFEVDTNMSAEKFCKFAAKKIMAANHRLLYGLWFGDKAACLNFHTLWNLSDYQDWELRSWQFDCDSDVLISEHQGDWLHAHNEEGTSVIF
jgi:hypothetical protein